MNSTVKNSLISATAAALASVTAVALWGAGNASNAQLAGAGTQVRVFAYNNQVPVNDFDGCSMVKLSEKVVTTGAGMITAHANVLASRDMSDPDAAWLYTRLTIDGRYPSQSLNILTTSLPGTDIHMQNSRKVSAGKHKIAIWASECDEGLAYIGSQHMIIQWTADGSQTTITE